MVFGVFMSAFDRHGGDRCQVDHNLSNTDQIREQLKAQQKELGKANRALALDYAITRVLGDPVTLSEAASLILHTICVTTGWEMGMLWDVDAQARKARKVGAWPPIRETSPGVPAHDNDLDLSTNEGLLGRIVESRRPDWFTDGDAHGAAFGMLEDGQQIRCGFAFPITVGREMFGALEFYSYQKRNPDSDLIEIFATIGSHIGYLLQRNRIELALRESESRFRTLTEAASDAIITIDESSKIMLVNPAAEQVFGYTIAEMVGHDLTMLMPDYFRQLHRAGLARHLKTGRRHTNWEAIELPGLHKSGREVPLEISFGEFTRGDQHFFTGIARDITERKRTEEALRKSEEERMLEMERIRQRIAADLHDDIGSSLTKIALLSEAARQRADGDKEGVHDSLAVINALSNELVETMSDIVWAINPHKDHVSDLAQRMRRFASDIFSARRISFRFDGPGTERDTRLGANARRETFLIFKESINNVVKHASCTEVILDLFVEDGWLTLTVSDDGIGFDPALVKASTGYLSSQRRGGNGLASMRRRTKELGGHLEIATRDGLGTRVSLRLPVGFGLEA